MSLVNSKTDAPAGEAAKPESRWEMIVNTTPVVLTVVATILAGLSSSEMSLAQYYRAIAAQHQSKAGDQWGYYQAKRTRQEILDNNAALLSDITGAVPAGPATAQQLADLPPRLQHAAEDVRRSLGISATTQPAEGHDSNNLWVPLNRFDQESARLFHQAEALAAESTQLLATPGVSDALNFLAGGLPVVADKPVDDPNLKAALAAIDAGESEQQTIPRVRAVREEKLREALATAQSNADAFDHVAKPVATIVDRVGGLAAREAALVRAFAHSVDALATTVAGQSPPAAAAVRAVAGPVKGDADALAGSFTASRFSYNARRDAAEAKYNMMIGRLYELQVRLSSEISERHRDRSKFFFYGMLAAQAGVTISTLSLAVRRRSLLWALASLVGLGAVIYAGYVYLFT